MAAMATTSAMSRSTLNLAAASPSELETSKVLLSSCCTRAWSDWTSAVNWPPKLRASSIKGAALVLPALLQGPGGGTPELIRGICGTGPSTCAAGPAT